MLIALRLPFVGGFVEYFVFLQSIYINVIIMPYG